jgi:hypothetical protein
MRIAIVSSPRSGNSWLRYVLRDTFSLQEIAVHNYLDIENVPEKCILQIHWYREPNFQEFLKRHDFQVISLARHPLDVLISVLHFIKYEPETAKWLCGNCAIPEELIGKSPASNEFLEYALGFGAENLLSVSYQWWHDKNAIKLRYEDLVTNSMVEVKRIAERLKAPVERLPDALASNSLESFKAAPNRHGWQGRPYLWRELIPFSNAAAIYAHHHRSFHAMNYELEQTALTHEAGELRWTELVR